MNNNQNNGGKDSSLSPSLRERQMEREGEGLTKAHERSYTPPALPEKKKENAANTSSIPPKSSMPKTQSIGNKEGLGNKGGLPPKEGLGNKNGIGGAPNNRAEGLKNKVASAGLQYMGVPKPISDKIVQSKLGKRSMLGMMHPALAAAEGVKNLAKTAGKNAMDKTSADKDAEEEAKEKQSGAITLRVPLSVKLIVFLGILPAFCFVVFFMAFIVSYIADKNALQIFIGKVIGNEEQREYLKFAEEMGVGAGLEEAVGKGTGNLTYDEFLSRRENLGNIYEQFDCESPEECLQRDEVKFYIKVNDIGYRYYQKYGITLDWELLMATAIGTNLDSNEMFSKFYHNYNYDDVENLDILMDLDWDYDYKKISGYNYLSPSNFQYDLQILAKNMVKKTTTQTCSKTVRNADGTTSTVITKTQTDEDIEDEYLQPGQPYYLKCSADETYNISSNYRLDTNKYDEFLSEYLENKLYLPETTDEDYFPDDNGTITIDHVTGDSISAAMVNLALSQQGVPGSYEHRGDNNVLYNTWYYGHEVSGKKYPWCAVFVSWVVAHTEYEGTQLKSILNNKTASVQNWATYMRDNPNLQLKNSRYLGGNYTPKQGDLIFYSWKTDQGACNNTGISTMDHIGIVVEVRGNSVVTIEGNASNKVTARSFDLNSCSITAYGVWY